MHTPKSSSLKIDDLNFPSHFKKKPSEDKKMDSGHKKKSSNPTMNTCKVGILK